MINSDERRNDLPSRNQSHETEVKAVKKFVLNKNKHKVLTELGIYETRRAEDQAAKQAKRTKTISERVGNWGLVLGYVLGAVPSSYAAIEVHTSANKFLGEGPTAAATVSTLIGVEIAFMAGGYYIGKTLGRRQALRSVS